MIDERQRPNMIICDINPEFDILEGEDNHRYLTWLKGHYDRKGIPEIFSRIDKTEKIKMLSYLYRYNSRVIELLSDFVYPVSNVRADGFSPLNSSFDKTKIKNHSRTVKQYKIDSVKIDFLNRFIEAAGEHNLVFVVSPRWYGMDTCQYKALVDICARRKIPFLDFSNEPKYVHNDIFFRDGNHLNALGADEFSKELAEYLKGIKGE